jgi:hypothetical protein
MFYLASCRYGVDCKFGHDYLLQEEQYEEMRRLAKKVSILVYLYPIHVKSERVYIYIRALVLL